MVPFTVALIGFAHFLVWPASKMTLLTYVCGAVGAVSCHVTMMLMVAALGLAGMGHLFAARERAAGMVGRWIIANVLTLVLVVPEL